ncbi:clathrin light chain [Lipomyces kononenkoae]|uniref:Clathrin light chain n=1 Tax=Lipomyces kononenkoae TaxID=34357 RepID=A0ACC3T063_LIPKO
MSYFPSLEEIDQGQIEARDAAGDAVDFGVPDNEEDFIARERAILGDADATALAGEVDLLNGDSGHTLSAAGENHLNNYSIQHPESFDTPAVPAESQEEVEPEVIKEWRERRELAIQRRDEQSESKKHQTREAAKQAIDDFYENYNDKKDKAIAQTRAEEQEFIESRENSVAGGTTWERIVKLVDISEKHARTSTVDKSRFRELLLSLKDDPNAPGAKGY